MRLEKVVFIVGPTAIGKSDIALALAERVRSQIVSCDSVQVYKEIHIASNKPSEECLSAVKHHLVNTVSLAERFDVSRYFQLASAAIKSVLAARQLPLVVGGSGLYAKILLDGIFNGEDPDLELREQLRREAEEHGPDYLYDRLTQADPLAAGKIHPNDLKKIIRALEVNIKEGRPISSKQQQCQGLWGKYDISVFGLNGPRDWLYHLINQRVDVMFDAGLIEEIEKLEGIRLSPSASGIIGIKEVRGYLQGEYDLDTAKHLMKQNTRRFAKRQLTWFRKEKRVNWIDVAPDTDKNKIAQYIKETAGI